MVGSAPVDDGRGGQSDHSGKRALSLVTVDHALLHFTQLPSSCGHVIESDFFVDFFFIASSDAQTTKFVDASCGFGTAGVSGTGLQELSTSSSWCVRAVCFTMAISLAMVDSDFVNDGRGGQSDHSGKTALTPVGQAGKTFELFITRDFLRWRGAPSSVCVTILRTNMFAHFLGLRGRSAIAQGSNPDGQGHHVGTRVQHESSPSFTPFGIVAKRLGFREMVKTHGHVSHCLPLVNNKLKVDCAILCCGQLLEFTRTSAFVRVCVCRALMQVMRTTSSRSVSLVVGKACARDGSLRPVSCNITRL